MLQRGKKLFRLSLRPCCAGGSDSCGVDSKFLFSRVHVQTQAHDSVYRSTVATNSLLGSAWKPQDMTKHLLTLLLYILEDFRNRAIWSRRLQPPCQRTALSWIPAGTLWGASGSAASDDKSDWAENPMPRRLDCLGHVGSPHRLGNAIECPAVRPTRSHLPPSIPFKAEVPAGVPPGSTFHARPSELEYLLV